MSGTDDDAVGYGRPPKHTRFGQPGGNGRGRGRTSRNLKTDLKELLNERVALTANGKPVLLSQQQAALKALAVSAIKGNVAAAAKLFDLVLKVLGTDEGDPVSAAMSAEDQAILEAYLKRNGGPDGN